MDNYFVIYDVRGIQKFIFRTNRVKEIVGASNIVRNLLVEELKVYFKEKNWKNITDWDAGKEFSFFNDKNIKVEFIYNGGGNLLLAFKGNDIELENMNKYIQVSMLKKSYGLSVAVASIKLKENECYKDARDRVKARLKDVKIKMPEIVLQKSLPIVECDPITGVHYSDVETYFKENEIDNYSKKIISKNVESAIKETFKDDKNNTTNLLDELLLPSKNNNTENDKNMLAIVHIDGNDMGAMINNYTEMIGESPSNKNNKLNYYDEFKKDVENSRYISATIDRIFNKNITKIIENNSAVEFKTGLNMKYSDYTRLIINSGDDITFICAAQIAFPLTIDIMRSIQKGSLHPKANYDQNRKTFKQNKFSSCAGICFIHPHFPFYRAYEMAEEVCSFAKIEAKKNKIGTDIKIKGENYERPSSYIDFHICENAILKDISEIRKNNKELFIRPYLVPEEYDQENYKSIDNLMMLLKIFRSKDKNNKNLIARSSIKEIRNTYEKPIIYSNILFERLKSRKSFNIDELHTLKEFENIDLEYDPLIKGKARYYDSSSLIDLVTCFSKDN